MCRRSPARKLARVPWLELCFSKLRLEWRKDVSKQCHSSCPSPYQQAMGEGPQATALGTAELQKVLGQQPSKQCSIIFSTTAAPCRPHVLVHLSLECLESAAISAHAALALAEPTLAELKSTLSRCANKGLPPKDSALSPESW